MSDTLGSSRNWIASGSETEVAILNPGEAAKLLAVLDQLYPNAKKATKPCGSG